MRLLNVCTADLACHKLAPVLVQLRAYRADQAFHKLALVRQRQQARLHACMADLAFRKLAPVLVQPRVYRVDRACHMLAQEPQQRRARLHACKVAQAFRRWVPEREQLHACMVDLEIRISYERYVVAGDKVYIHTGLSTSWLRGSDGDWFSLTLARLAGFSAGGFWKSVGDRLCVTPARLTWNKS